MSRTWEVLRFELAYQLTRVSTRIYFLLFLAFAGMAGFAFLLDARNDGYYFNAPIITIAVTVVASMVALLVIAGVASDAATRDHDVRLDALLYTTPLRKAAYLGGRFLGAFVVTAVLLLAVPLALIATSALPNLEPALIGPFRPGAYLASYFFFALPNAFVGTAILFSLAALTRRAIASYGGAIFLFFFATFAEGLVANRMGRWGVGKLLDPLGFTTMRSLWRSLNPLQRNTLLPGLDGALLTNRLLWLGIALSVLAFAFARFRFAHAAASGGGNVSTNEAPATRWTRVSVPAVRRGFSASTRIQQLIAIATRSFRELVTSRGWLLVPFTAIVFLITAPELLEVELGTPGSATTARVAAILCASETVMLIAVMIALCAGELTWRERDARMNAIADVAPVPEWLSVCGKFMGLALMLGAAQAIYMLCGIAVQLMHGGAQIDLAMYAKVLFGFQLTKYLLFAALAMIVHTLTNQKYVGNVLIVLAYVGTDMAHEYGLEHYLLLYGRTPGWAYSEISGFGPQLEAWRWLTLYWAGWALVFAVVTYLFWIRGEERGLRTRLLLARRRLTKGPALVAAAALALILGAGGFTFYNTNILNPYYTDAELDERRANYERRYGKYASLPQPILAATKLNVDFFPERSAAKIRGTYRLDNRGNAPIASIHLVTHSEIPTTGVTFDRPAHLSLTDDEVGYRIYDLATPLQPGQSLQMHFEIAYARRGFTNSGGNESVVANGSWIQHRGDHRHGERQWLPVVGYQRNREHGYPAVRKRLGLPERPRVAKLEDLSARQERKGSEKIAFEAIVGTTEGQIGVAPGELRRVWSENGRRYAHYVTDAPISNGYAIYSANYAIRRDRWRDVAIEVFHHPGHTANIGRMVKSVKASLDYHTREFGPYPHKQLRLVEYPSAGAGSGLTSFPGMIEYSEGFALVRPADDARDIDFPFAVMSHEMGHQWWGHRLVPALVEGAPVLSESLAWYSAMLTVEETFGRDHLQRLLAVMRAEYLAPHQTRETPLMRSFDRLDAYRTGPFAMFALRETIGEERVNESLRRLLARFDPARPPYPTALDLYAELRAATPPDSHDLLKDLFEEITFWDLKAKKLGVQRAGNAYRVTLEVDAQKLKANPLGKETMVAMNDLIDVAAYDANGNVLYRKPHRIHGGVQTITLTLPAAPVRASVDPDRVLLDRRPDDNDTEAEAAN